jgi:transcriptional regulator with XRE-family HTH domain
VAAGFTQTQLADKARISKAQVCNLESGRTKRPYLSTASPIALALGLTIADLWPTLAKAVRKGRLLDTAIPIAQAVKPKAVDRHGMTLVYDSATAPARANHSHRPPICCGCMFCRVVDLNDPETYRVIGEPTLIAAGGANA